MACAKRSIASSCSPREILLEAAEIPGGRQVGIEHQRPVEQCDAAVEVAAEMAERVAAAREGDRIVLAQLHRPAGQASALGDLLARDRSSSR